MATGVWRQEEQKFADHKNYFVSRIAGNPNDPIKKEGGEAAAYGGMSAEDRRLSESVARSVMRITHEVKEWDETETVSLRLTSCLQYSVLLR